MSSVVVIVLCFAALFAAFRSYARVVKARREFDRACEIRSWDDLAELHRRQAVRLGGGTGGKRVRVDRPCPWCGDFH